MIARLVLLALVLSASVPVAPPVARAQVEPEPPRNNPVGINLVRWQDRPYLQAAAQLVNSNGGDWGYVTVLLIDEDRRDPDRFQRFLDQCAQLRLTPIVRIGTHYDPQRRLWDRPLLGAPYAWRLFFSRLRWPTESRYLIVGNEPNLGYEWGGAVDPAGYARYLASWIDMMAYDPRYRIFNGALDASNDTLLPERMDELEFIDGMRAAVPDIFARLHGWASSPYHFWWGTELRYTYRAYESELEAIGREMPVIVTEFHPQHIDDPIHVANWYETAFTHWLADPRVVAATPMFWNPERNQFWMFAVSQEGAIVRPSPTYQRIRALPKAAGSPTFRPRENVPRPLPTPTELPPSDAGAASPDPAAAL